MSNITQYPLVDDFETTLSKEWNGGTGTMYLNSVPAITIPSGVTFILTVNSGKSTMQAVVIDSIDPNAKTVNVSSISVNKGASLAYSQQIHSIGSSVKISNNYANWKNVVDAVNDKLDLNGGESTDGTFDITVTGSNFRIRKDGSDMKLTDDNQSEITLSTLASGGGADEKIKISSNDTTAGYLNGKMVAGDGISFTENNDGGNETLDVDVDTTDTNVFSATKSAGKVPLLNGSGEIDDFLSASIPAKATDPNDDTDDTSFITPQDLSEWIGFEILPLTISTSPDTTGLLQSADTERNTTSTSYTKVKEIVATFDGTYTVAFDMRETIAIGGINAHARVYKNGVAFGAEQTAPDITYVEKLENLTFSAGDLVQLYIKTTNASIGCRIRNFRLYGTVIPKSLTLTVNQD